MDSLLRSRKGMACEAICRAQRGFWRRVVKNEGEGERRASMVRIVQGGGAVSFGDGVSGW